MHKESKNGAEDYPVYVHRWSGEVRRLWTGSSGEANSDSLLGELHRGVHSLFQGSGVAGKGSAGRSTVAGARVAAGTPFAGQTPVISGSGEVESTRGSTVEASVGFIGASASRRHRHGLAEVESARGSTVEALVGFIGAGASRRHERGSARRGARGVGRWACSGALRARRTRGSVLLPLFNSSPRSQACESWQKSSAGLLLAPRAVSCM